LNKNVKADKKEDDEEALRPWYECPEYSRSTFSTTPFSYLTTTILNI
jgi:hypothetical protein